MLSLLIVAATCCYGRWPPADWPQFRGPTGDGVSDATNVPVEWSATDHVAWKQPIPGVGWSSPVLSNGKLYLTTAVGDDKDARCRCARCA